MFDKNEKLDVPCPGCEHITSITIAEIETNPSYQCAGCGETVNIDASKLTDGLKDAENQINDMVGSLQDMFK